MGCHSLLQGIFPTQRSDPGLLKCMQVDFYILSHQGSLGFLAISYSVSEAQPKAFTPARPDQPCHPRHLPIHPSMCTEYY